MFYTGCIIISAADAIDVPIVGIGLAVFIFGCSMFTDASIAKVIIDYNQLSMDPQMLPRLIVPIFGTISFGVTAIVENV